MESIVQSNPRLVSLMSESKCFVQGSITSKLFVAVVCQDSDAAGSHG